MAYRIAITREAKAQLQGFPVREQRIIGDGIAARLLDQPAVPSRAVKPLRPNPLADYELRLGDLRVLYKIDEENFEVVVVALGRKVGNTLIVEGEGFMDTRVIPLSDLQADPEAVLGRCFDSGEPLLVDLPDRGLIAIRPVDPHDDLVNDLIENNASFRALLAKSLASPREPFPFTTP